MNKLAICLSIYLCSCTSTSFKREDKGDLLSEGTPKIVSTSKELTAAILKLPTPTDSMITFSLDEITYENIESEKTYKKVLVGEKKFSGWHDQNGQFQTGGFIFWHVILIGFVFDPFVIWPTHGPVETQSTSDETLLIKAQDRRQISQSRIAATNVSLTIGGTSLQPIENKNGIVKFDLHQVFMSGVAATKLVLKSSQIEKIFDVSPIVAIASDYRLAVQATEVKKKVSSKEYKKCLLLDSISRNKSNAHEMYKLQNENMLHYFTVSEADDKKSLQSLKNIKVTDKMCLELLKLREMPQASEQ